MYTYYQVTTPLVWINPHLHPHQDQLQTVVCIYMYTNYTIISSQATPRLYLAVMEKQLRDKIWEWPGNEANKFQLTNCLLNMKG